MGNIIYLDNYRKDKQEPLYTKEMVKEWQKLCMQAGTPHLLNPQEKKCAEK